MSRRYGQTPDDVIPDPDPAVQCTWCGTTTHALMDLRALRVLHDHTVDLVNDLDRALVGDDYQRWEATQKIKAWRKWTPAS